MNDETQRKLTYLDCNSERSYGMIAQDAYIGCALRFGWVVEKKSEFGLRKLLYARNATPEGYAVWFLPHSNLSGSSHQKNLWENKVVGDEIEECWRVPHMDDHGDDGMARVTFVKRENGKYYFQGVYRLASTTRRQDAVTHKVEQIKLYRRVSETYPFEEKDPLPADRLRSLRAYIAQHYRLPEQKSRPEPPASIPTRVIYDVSEQDLDEKENPFSDVCRMAPCPPPEASCAAIPRSKATALEIALPRPEDDFAKTLLTALEAKGISNAECYKRANIDRKLFSKIISNEGYTPRKPTAIALILTLHPSEEEMTDLLRRLGYCLSHSSFFDLTIEWCLQNKVYETDEVNVLLDGLGLPLLGSY